MSTLGSIFKRASNLIVSLGEASDKSQEEYTIPNEGEVIYCKNNVCVHPPSSQQSYVNHHPGYLSIKGHFDEVHHMHTLVLSWIPNSTLKSNPRSVENRSVNSSPCRSSRSSACPSPKHSSPLYSSINEEYLSNCTSPRPSSCCEKSSEEYTFNHSIFKPISSENDRQDAQSLSSLASDFQSPSDTANSLDGSWTNIESDKETTISAKEQSVNVTQIDSGIGPEEVSAALKSMISGLNDFENIHAAENNKASNSLSERDSTDSISNFKNSDSKDIICDDSSLLSNNSNSASKNDMPVINIGGFDRQSSGDSGQTSSNDETDNTSSMSLIDELDTKPKFSTPFYIEGTPESLAHAHNLTFPDASANSTPYHSARHSTFENTCGVFSVDLAQMRSLRLFYSDMEQTCGQLVIASRQSQYKILHFHYGGLDKLAQVFVDWSFLLKSGREKVMALDANECHHFSICLPTVDKGELHPDDSLYRVVDEQRWKSFMNNEGQILDDFQLRKNIFFGGLDSEIRNETWPFLLHYYSFYSTFSEREQIRNDRYIEYQNIRKKREKLSKSERELFIRNIQSKVDKDVVRTDCSNPFFAGDNNPNVANMRNILLNYAIYNPSMGYTQGMSDLLAPILIEIQEEAMVFWCFVGLMQRTLFVSLPMDLEMDIHLKFLRELIRIMIPNFYEHICKYEDAKELLFCHRWILLCFKREFKDSEALRMWEACWSHYQTDYFQMFICAAIISIYGEDVIQQNLPPDEMLLHFSSLALHMDGDLVLRKARGLLHQFRLLPTIPCTLHGLCEMTESSMWDTGCIVTQIDCICSQDQSNCPAIANNKPST